MVCLSAQLVRRKGLKSLGHSAGADVSPASQSGPCSGIRRGQQTLILSIVTGYQEHVSQKLLSLLNVMK